MAGHTEKYVQNNASCNEPPPKAIETQRCTVQVVPASQDPLVSSKPPEPGYEVTRSGPTTNFVGMPSSNQFDGSVPKLFSRLSTLYYSLTFIVLSGNHMTQEAIDLVQAELEDCPPSLPLLQNKPHVCLKSIAACEHAEHTALLQPIDSYTWWDTGNSICISISTPAALSASATVERNVQRQLLSVNILSPDTAGQLAYSLKLDPLYSEIKPEASKCSVSECVKEVRKYNQISPEGALSSGTTQQADDMSLDGHADITDQPCSVIPTGAQAMVRLHKQLTCLNECANQVSQDLVISKHPDSVAHSITASCKPKPAVVVTLVKANTSEAWPSLTGSKIKSVHQQKAHRPAQPADMAALRRALIKQRQQTKLSPETQAGFKAPALLEGAASMQTNHALPQQTETDFAPPAVDGGAESSHAKAQPDASLTYMANQRAEFNVGGSCVATHAVKQDSASAGQFLEATRDAVRVEITSSRQNGFSHLSSAHTMCVMLRSADSCSALTCRTCSGGTWHIPFTCFCYTLYALANNKLVVDVHCISADLTTTASFG